MSSDRGKARTVCLYLSLLLFAAAAVAQSTAEEMTAKLRQSLEKQFRESTGLGFSHFQCNLPGNAPPGREFTCEAIDEEGDKFFYRILFENEGQPPYVTTTQPVDQLDPAGREVLERPCLEFLAAFGNEQWDQAYQTFPPELQDVVSLGEFRASLDPVRQAMGRIETIEASSYSTPAPGLHLLEYTMATEGGAAAARFKLQFVDQEQAKMVAFLISAAPGSSLQARLLSVSGRQVLTSLLGQSVGQIDAPFAELRLLGDAVEGTAVLDDGSEIMIRIEQHGTAHDLDDNDYRFQVLDVPWLIRTYLISTGEAPLEVDCPSRTAPDGGSVECVATMEDGSRRAIKIGRRGGDHRLLQ